MLRGRRRGLGLALVLALAGCGTAAGGPMAPRAQRVTVAGRVLVITPAGGDVCVGRERASAVCVPVAPSEEAVPSAALAPFDPDADLLVVISRPGVDLTGLGPDARHTTVRLGGREAEVWLNHTPVGTGRVCSRYRSAAGAGRLVVHRSVALDGVAAAEVKAAGRSDGDAC